MRSQSNTLEVLTAHSTKIHMCKTIITSLICCMPITKHAYLFFSKGTFAFHSDRLLLSHHYEGFILCFLLVCGAAMGVEFSPLVTIVLYLLASLWGGRRAACVNIQEQYQ